MTGIAHGSAEINRNSGTKSRVTRMRRVFKSRGMPVRDKSTDPYQAPAVRVAIQTALDNADKKKSSVGKGANISDRTVSKFLSGGTESIRLENAVRLAHYLGITVSELIGEAMPAPEIVPDEDLERLVEELQAQTVAHTAALQAVLAQMRARRRKR